MTLDWVSQSPSGRFLIRSQTPKKWANSIPKEVTPLVVGELWLQQDIIEWFYNLVAHADQPRWEAKILLPKRTSPRSSSVRFVALMEYYVHISLGRVLFPRSSLLLAGLVTWRTIQGIKFYHIVCSFYLLERLIISDYQSFHMYLWGDWRQCKVFTGTEVHSWGDQCQIAHGWIWSQHELKCYLWKIVQHCPWSSEWYTLNPA